MEMPKRTAKRTEHSSFGHRRLGEYKEMMLDVILSISPFRVIKKRFLAMSIFHFNKNFYLS